MATGLRSLSHKPKKEPNIYIGEPKPRTTPAVRLGVVKAKFQGLPIRAIARRYDIVPGTVRNIWSRFNKRKSLVDRKSTGRPHKITPRIFAQLKPLLESGALRTVRDVVKWLEDKKSMHVSALTVRTTLRQHGFSPEQRTRSAAGQLKGV